MKARLVALVAALFALALPASAAAKSTIQPPDRTRLGQTPLVVKDGHANQTALRKVAVRAAASGRDYPVGNGETVRVLTSPSYQADDSLGQQWANFFASLLHDFELSDVTVYFAPYDEVTSLCSTDADACYDPSTEQIVLPGEPPPDGTSVEDLAAHEYGHQVANNRDNSPWPAEDWGPKRWASYEGVCPRVRARTAFPGAEGGNYALNPGEAFAESYRVANGGSSNWDIVDKSWFPNSTDLSLIRADAIDPYAGGSTGTWRGDFRRHQARDRYITLSTPLDGSLVVRLRGQRGLDGDLYVYDHATGKLIAKRNTYSRNETLRTTICGPSKVDVDIYRYKGYGSWTAQLTRP